MVFFLCKFVLLGFLGFFLLVGWFFVIIWFVGVFFVVWDLFVTVLCLEVFCVLEGFIFLLGFLFVCFRFCLEAISGVVTARQSGKKKLKNPLASLPSDSGINR